MAYGYNQGNAGSFENRYIGSPADVAEQQTQRRVAQQGLPATNPHWNPNGTLNLGTLGPDYGSYTNYLSQVQQGTLGSGGAPSGGALRSGSSGSSSGGGGGFRFSGGGGGGAAAPKLNQAQLDWMTQLLRGSAPDPTKANTLTLPQYRGMAMRPFDPSLYNTMLNALNAGAKTDLATAQQSTQDMLNYLGQNYTNAFNNPNNTYATAGQAPGMDQQSMARMLNAQGVNTGQAMGPTYNASANADQAFGSLWKTLAANEDIAQRSRLANARQYGTQSQAAINAAAAAGRLGIGLGEGQAQSAWQQAADQRAYQDYQIQQQLAQQQAMENWNRGNTVQDANTAAANSYRNSELQAMLGLLPQLIASPKLRLPNTAALGL